MCKPKQSCEYVLIYWFVYRPILADAEIFDLLNFDPTWDRNVMITQTCNENKYTHMNAQMGAVTNDGNSLIVHIARVSAVVMLWFLPAQNIV